MMIFNILWFIKVKQALGLINLHHQNSGIIRVYKLQVVKVPIIWVYLKNNKS